MQINGSSLEQHAAGHTSLTQVSAKEFGAKFKSKRECYTFLATECEVYLPPYAKCLPIFNLIHFILQIM